MKHLCASTVNLCVSNCQTLVKVPVNKGTLLSKVRVATVRKCKSNVKGVWVEGEVCHLWMYLLTKERC